MQLQPTIAAEVGWSESYPRLKRDIRLWLKGSVTTNVALLINFNERSRDRVAGFVEVYRKDAFGEPMLSSRHVSLEPYYLAFAILTVLFFKGDLSCCPRSRYVRHHNGRIVGSRYSAWPKSQRHVGFQCGQAQAECYGRCSPDGVV